MCGYSLRLRVIVILWLIFVFQCSFVSLCCLKEVRFYYNFSLCNYYCMDILPEVDQWKYNNKNTEAFKCS